MKTIMWTLGVATLVVGGALMLIPSKVEVVAQEPTVVVEHVEVDALEKAVKEAQEARRSEMEAIAQKAYDEALNQEMKKTELEVVKTFNASLNARQTELEKETKTY